ncbi:MAG: hypothetical protein IKS35_03475 [Clostridia bacterium]|nr:hypothetical protein [Clostridia bacterium]
MFWKENSYDCVKMYVTQIAISLFGFSLALACARIPILEILTSVMAIVFYLVLLYIAAWKIGFKHHNAREHGKPDIPLRGLLISLVANIPNFLLATLYAIGTPWKEEWAGGFCYVVRTIMLLTEGMYEGILAEFWISGERLREFWWPFFLIIIPALLATWMGYELGLRDLRIIQSNNNTKKS